MDFPKLVQWAAFKRNSYVNACGRFCFSTLVNLHQFRIANSLCLVRKPISARVLTRLMLFRVFHLTGIDFPCVQTWINQLAVRSQTLKVSGKKALYTCYFRYEFNRFDISLKKLFTEPQNLQTDPNRLHYVLVHMGFDSIEFYFAFTENLLNKGSVFRNLSENLCT